MNKIGVKVGNIHSHIFIKDGYFAGYYSDDPDVLFFDKYGDDDIKDYMKTGALDDIKDKDANEFRKKVVKKVKYELDNFKGDMDYKKQLLRIYNKLKYQ